MVVDEATLVALTLLFALMVPFAPLFCFDEDEFVPALEWLMDELCLYDLGLGFDCLVYPDPPPPLVLELVEELPGECWDVIPPGPGPGGDETLVDDVLP